MKSMTPLGGEPIDRSDRPNFVWNADLIAYDGPLVSLFKDEENDFIFLWVDCDKSRHRWIVMPASRELLLGYLRRTLPLRALIEESDLLLVFESTPKAQRRNFRWIKPTQLPEAYWPSADSYLYPEIATEAATELAKVRARKYKIKLDGELYIEDIATVPRLYQQLYSFHYGLANLGRAAVKSALNRALEKWTGGFTAVNIFTGLRSVIPSIHRARVIHLEYASPGHIELELLKTLAEEIDSSCDRILSKPDFKAAETLYSEIYAYFRQERISGFDSETRLKAAKLTPRQKSTLTGYVNDYFDLMAWDEERERFASLGLDPLAQLRLLLAYYRRLRSLRKFVVEGKIKLT